MKLFVHKKMKKSKFGKAALQVWGNSSMKCHLRREPKEFCVRRGFEYINFYHGGTEARRGTERFIKIANKKTGSVGLPVRAKRICPTNSITYPMIDPYPNR